MTAIAVRKVKGTEADAAPFLDEIHALLAEVERRAFDLFERRGAALGRALDDWLEAERETLAAPPAELAETPGGYVLRMAIPGFAAKEVEVTATPQELFVRAEHSPTAAGGGERLCWSELPHDGKACRRVPLPEPIDVGKVTATLADGLLRIEAAKAEAPKSREAAA